MKKIINILIFVPLFTLAQIQSVGIKTVDNPTETLQVNGTTRITNLPANKAENAISTDENGNYAQNQTFKATRTMVVDENGVAGSLKGIPVIDDPNNNYISYKTITVPIDGNTQTNSEITLGNLTIRFDGDNTDTSNGQVSNYESTFSIKVNANVAPDNVILNQLKIGLGGIYGGQNEVISVQPNVWYPITKQAPRVSYYDFVQYNIALIENQEVYRLTGSVNEAISASSSRIASPAQVTIFLERLTGN